MSCGGAALPAKTPGLPAANPAAAKEEARRLNNEATAAYDLGDFPKAIGLFKEAYEQNAYSQILFNLGQAYRQNGQYDLALNTYQAYLRNEPNISADDRTIVEEHIHDLEKLLAAQKQNAARPPTGVSPIGSTPGGALMAPPAEPQAWYQSPLGWSLAAVGVAAIASGIGVWISVGPLNDKLATAPDPEVPGIRSDISTRKTIGTVLLVGGGLVLASGITVFILKEKEHAKGADAAGQASAGALRLELRVGPAWVGVHGSF
jgi:tetratricopeptide (TPR) repeat protein